MKRSCRYGWMSSAVTAFSLLVAATAVGQTAGVTTADPNVRIRPTDSYTAASSPSFSGSAARNEFFAFQIVLVGGSAGMSGIRFPDSTPTAVCLADAVSPPYQTCNFFFYRESYVDTTQTPFTGPSEPDGSRARWPDALIPLYDEYDQHLRTDSTYTEGFYNFNGTSTAWQNTVPAGENRVVWVEVLIPPNFIRDTYTATIPITWSGGSKNVAVSVQVRDFTLPATSSVATLFRMNGGSQLCDAMFSGADQTDCLNSTDPTDPKSQVSVRTKFGRFLLDHRLTSDFMMGIQQCSQGSACDSTESDWDWSRFETAYGHLIDGAAGYGLTRLWA